MNQPNDNIAYFDKNHQCVCPQIHGNLALQEELLYHNPENKGFVSFLIKNEKGNKKIWRRNSCYVSEIDNFRAKIPENTDIYITQNEFKRPGSKTIHFKRTQVSFLDIDIYKSEAFRGVYLNDVKVAILDYCEIEGIPKPSLIINSGRGLYLKWLYTKPIPYPALPRWKAMQKHLWGIFEEFGADRKALDASRVLRVVGTINSKNNKMCKIAWENIDESGELVRYDFDTIFDQIMPLTREKIKQLRKEKAERHRKRKEKALLLKKLGKKKYNPAKIGHIFNTYSLNFARFEDLRILNRLRGWDSKSGVGKGFRERMLFFACNFLSGFVSEERLRSEMDAVGEEFTPTLSKAERKSYCSSVIRQKVEKMKMKEYVRFTKKKRFSSYIYTNKQIIEELEITEEEQQELKTIISQKEKNRRRRELFEMSFDEYRKKRKNDLEEKRMEISRLKELGMKNYQIAIKWGVTENTIRNIMKVK